MIRKSAQLRGLGQDLLGDNGHRISCSVKKQTNKCFKKYKNNIEKYRKVARKGFEQDESGLPSRLNLKNSDTSKCFSNDIPKPSPFHSFE